MTADQWFCVALVGLAVLGSTLHAFAEAWATRRRGR